MHIGLIGGIGPAATVAYYNHIVARFKKAQLELELTIVHADVSVLVGNAGSDSKQAQAEVFAKHLQQLKGAGCDIAAITALTGHFCFDEVKNLSPLPLASAIEPLDEFCKASGFKTVGLLGSPPVMSSRLFGLLESVGTVIPNDNMELLGKAYLDMATSGKCPTSTQKMFIDAGAEMMETQGADAIILAGTDLGLAFNEIDPGYRVIDALDVHVEALLALALTSA